MWCFLISPFLVCEMHDLKLLRENPGRLREALKRRNSPLNLDGLLALEKSRRELLGAIEQQRHQLKQESDAYAREKAGSPPAHLKQLSSQIKEQEQRLKLVEEQISQELAVVPNIPHDSVPVGDARANQVVRTVGDKPVFSFTPKSHMDIGQERGMIDLERASKISGSHFPLLKGKGARLERALINWMLDVQTKEHGYTEIAPPYLVNRAAMFGTGQLPKFEEDMYRLKDDDLFLIPTAEVPVTNMHKD